MVDSNIDSVEEDTRSVLRSYGVSEQDIERVVEAGRRSRERHEKIVTDLDAGLIQNIDLIFKVQQNMTQLNDEWKSILDEEVYNKFMNIS